MKKLVVFLTLLLALGLLVPGVSAVNIVTTMPNLWDVAGEIGGDSVIVMYVAPPAAVHVSSDTIDALLQQNSEFIRTADIFLGQGGSMDGTVITKVTEFRKKNFDEDTDWLLLSNVSKDAVPNVTVAYDNPKVLQGYSETITYLLSTADSLNASVYQKNLNTYLKKISEETKLSADEQDILSNIPIICHFRIKNQAVNWLGMDCINSYPDPTTAKDLIDDIHQNPNKYKSIAANSSIGKIVVIENIVAGSDMGIGVHEALKDTGVPCERIIFLNLPKSAENVDTIFDYYAYNKNLILSLASPSETPTTTQSPVGPGLAFVGILGAALLLRRN
ncbi:metal ABC transporter solute-binding protein, Zn/Mn family [Methanorbis rubei]|uniref:Uncharacterized protein n=1 Tax=Methanorbis rubei TaxID=3028300 RepID=A0AAE4SBI2_9EURY|nr:hypothetical protein [Methanocorpusculaceae archaeon Cs1]